MMRSGLVLALCLALPTASPAFEYGKRNSTFPPAFPEQTRAPLVESGYSLRVRALAQGLERPWGIATLPGNDGWLVTERPGRLRHVAPNGQVSAPIASIPRVLAARQGGLLDVVLAPDFSRSRVIYLTYAKPVQGGSVTAAARMVLAEDMGSVRDVADIFVQQPPSPTPAHFGSRLVPLRDGTLAITTGEHSSQREMLFAQHMDKTYGKVVRVNPDGTIPGDNPFVGVAGADPAIWSLGHRNIQGATLDANGRLWTIEHGPRGGDELNRPQAGRNYGWPTITYGIRYRGGAVGDGIAVKDGMEQPVYFWDPVIAPAGMAFHSGRAFADWNGDILASSLNPGGVVRLTLDRRGRVVEEERLLMELGRVRDVEILSDGTFLVLTDDTNGAVLHISPE